MIRRPTIAETLDQLVRDGAISDATRSSLGETALGVEPEHTPWFVRLLTGLGAWVAAGLFLLFLVLSDIVTSEEDAIVGGLIFVVATTALRRMCSHDFWVQLAMAGNVTGQLLSIGGVIGATESVSGTAVFALFLEAALLAFYPDVVMRFLTAAGAAGALLAVAIDADTPVFADVVAIMTMIGGGWIWLAPARWDLTAWGERRLPAAYGLILFGLGLLAAHVIAAQYPDYDPWMLAWPTTLGLSISFIALTLYIMRGYGLQAISEPALVVLAATGLVCAATYDSPGVIASLGVFALAVQRRSFVLLGIAFLFLVGFVIFFYYSLAATLLAKSGMLFGVGLVLLVLRFHLRARWRVTEAKAS